MPEEREGQKDSPPDTQDKPHMDRREFMRRAAQVGGLTALGLVGAETILPAVLERIARLTGNRRLAFKIADGLARNGLLTTAQAADCVPGQNYMIDCPDPEDNFGCGQSSYSTCSGTLGYACPGMQFTCGGPSNFTCGTSQQPGHFFFCDTFLCDGPDFTCTGTVGSGASFACDTQVDCGTPNHYGCNEGAQYSSPGCC